MWAQSLLTRLMQRTPDCSDSCGDTHFNETPRSALTALTLLYKQVVFHTTGAFPNPLDSPYHQLLKTEAVNFYFPSVAFGRLGAHSRILGETLLLLQSGLVSKLQPVQVMALMVTSCTLLPDKLLTSDSCHSGTSVQGFMDNVTSIR